MSAPPSNIISWRGRMLGALFACAVVGAIASAKETQRLPEPPPATEVARLLIEAFNRHDPAALAERVSPDFIWYNVSSDETTIEVKGRDALRESLTKYFVSTPSVRSEIDGVTQVGPFVCFREQVFWTSSKGERSQQSLAVYEVHDGLITRAWYYPAVK